MGYLPEGLTTMPGEEGSPERMEFLWSLPATIELTHNHGSEEKEGQVYHTGNSYDGVEGGFGHIGITVPDVYAACDRFKELGVEFKKSPNAGGMKVSQLKYLIILHSS
jgi:lactoylglutathione lyase